MLTWSRYSALIFAIGLGIGETILNWGHWQYAPLWIVDYIVTAWLLLGFFKTRDKQNIPILFGGWAFAAGVFYMALFISLDPDLSPQINANWSLLIVIGVMLTLSMVGFLSAFIAMRRNV